MSDQRMQRMEAREKEFKKMQFEPFAHLFDAKKYEVSDQALSHSVFSHVNESIQSRGGRLGCSSRELDRCLGDKRCRSQRTSATASDLSSREDIIAWIRDADRLTFSQVKDAIQWIRDAEEPESESSLDSVNVSGYNLDSLHWYFHDNIEYFMNVKVLDASKNLIGRTHGKKVFPERSWVFQELYKIDLSQNGLSNLSGFRLKHLHFPNLRILNLSNNQLISLSGVKNLSMLVHLNVSNNCIEDISKICHLVSLRSLNLSGNLLTSYESLSSLAYLRKLFALNLSQNPVSRLNEYHWTVSQMIPWVSVLDTKPIAIDYENLDE